jgi:hypothetical protein
LSTAFCYSVLCVSNQWIFWSLDQSGLAKMNLLPIPKLTDCIIFFQTLTAEDAAEHLAGEYDEMVNE